MSFKFTVKQNPLTIEFEAGSIKEGLGILQDSGTELSAMFAQITALGNDSSDAGLTIDTTADNSQTQTGPLTVQQIAANAEKVAADAEAKTLPQSGPGRPKLTERQKAANAAVTAANKAATKGTGNPSPPPPVTAAAPAPLPIPGAPLNTQENPKTGVPGFLDRTAPPPPPVPPPAPPVNRLADTIIANLKMRKGQTADNGAALVTWLAQTGIVAGGASFDEAMAVLQFQTDDKLAPIAGALQVTV